MATGGRILALTHIWRDSLYSLYSIISTFSVRLKNKSPISSFLTSTTIRNSFYFYIGQSRWAFFKFKFLTHIINRNLLNNEALLCFHLKITHIFSHKKLYNLYCLKKDQARHLFNSITLKGLKGILVAPNSAVV